MLRWRIPLGTLIVAAVVGLCWLDHVLPVAGAVLLPLAVLFVVGASGEMLHLLGCGGLRPSAGAVYAGNVLLVVGSWLLVVSWDALDQSLAGGHRSGASIFAAAGTSILLAFGAAMLVVFAAEMRRYEKPGGATANVAAALLAVAYVGLLMSFVVQLRMVWGVAALASLLIVVKLGDIGAYTVGRLVGRHKMAPVLSPGKTVEGGIGALLFAAAGSWATFRWLVPSLGAALPDGGFWGWIAFGLVVGAAGMLGDLAESMIKRDVGQKDSSRWMPGFGGVLDLLDSVLFAAPAAYACWALGLVGG